MRSPRASRPARTLLGSRYERAGLFRIKIGPFRTGLALAYIYCTRVCFGSSGTRLMCCVSESYLFAIDRNGDPSSSSSSSFSAVFIWLSWWGWGIGSQCDFYNNCAYPLQQPFPPLVYLLSTIRAKRHVKETLGNAFRGAQKRPRLLSENAWITHRRARACTCPLGPWMSERNWGVQEISTI